jgi:phosphatidylglycerol:prolipoprotein diacylglycerol transferase
MIPYLDLPTFGPINSFGILVMLGVFFGSTAAYRHSERLGLDQGRVRRMALFCGVFGLLGAHVFDVLVYQPGWMNEDGAIWTLLDPFAGISSMGGVLGGTLGFVLFAHLTGINKLKFADTATLGLLVLLTFGRAGCASVHDHVGASSDFALAVNFPAGNPAGAVGPHHDLGLYEFMLLLALLVIAAFILRKPRRPGLLVGILAIAYAVPRFFLDFLRRPVSDPRYLELTPAQWSTLAMLIAGGIVLYLVYRKRELPPPIYLQPTPWRTYAANIFRLRSRAAST